MKRPYFILSLVLNLLLSFNLFPQNNQQNFYRFRALLKNGNHVEGKNATLTSGELRWISKTGNQLSMPINEIRAMDRYTGTHAVRGAVIGGGLGLLTGLSLILYANADEDRELKVSEGYLLSILAVSYGLIGLAIGSAFSTWQRVPLDLSIRYDPSRKLRSFSIKFSISKLVSRT